MKHEVKYADDDLISKESKYDSDIGLPVKDLSPVKKLNNKTLFMTEKKELAARQDVPHFPKLKSQKKFL